MELGLKNINEIINKKDMKTELSIANERILELENEVKILSSNIRIPSEEDIDRKWFFPSDKTKDESAIVGAKWLRHFLLGNLDN